MSKLDILMMNFYGILSSINDDNVVLGGTNALLLHGLKMSREPNDLDIIIYRPNSEQVAKIHNYAKANSGVDNRISEDDAVIYDSIKVTDIKGNVINFIFESREKRKNLLLWKGINVESIEGVINAKSGYNREKDVKDFEDLKKSNFNLFNEVSI